VVGHAAATLKRRATVRAAPTAPTLWRNFRVALLLLLLGIAAYWNWYDRASTTDWDETLWVGVFPIDADGSAATARWLTRLTQDDVTAIEAFLNGEAHRHGVAIDRPVRVDLYPRVEERPPELDPDSSVLARVGASLRLRFYARRNSHPSGRAPPQIRVFVLFHDPELTSSVPHSVGLQKGLVGVVHAFADDGMTPTNNVVIAHEILHTLGATDKYDPATLEPIYPSGYAEPGLQPRLPQKLTEVMAGRHTVAAGNFEMPDSLRDVRVGAATAQEIRWPAP
jgi:hypothetical protein